LASLVTAIAVLILAAAALLAAHWDSTVTAAAFADARGNQTMLRNFLYRMPKGGDLHVHLSGGVYAERYIAWAVADRLCVRVSDDAIVNRPVDKDENTLPCDQAAGMLPIDEAVGEVDTPARQQTYDRIVNALSMRDFRPTAAEPTGHDHFFAVFGKFSAAAGPHFADMIVNLLASYGAQSAQYVELMTSFSGFSEREKFVQAITGKADYKSKLDALNAAGLTAFIAQKKKELDDATAEVDKKRDCDPQKTKPGCMVNYRFIAPRHARRRLRADRDRRGDGTRRPDGGGVQLRAGRGRGCRARRLQRAHAHRGLSRRQSARRQARQCDAPCRRAVARPGAARRPHLSYL